MDKDLADRLLELQKEDVYVGHDEAGNYYVTKGSDPNIQQAVASGKTSGKISVPAAQATGWAARVSNGSGTQVDSASITLNKDTGKITIEAPSNYFNDDQVKRISDSGILEQLSRNYKQNKNVKYQDPNDETKQIDTETYVSMMSDALQDRVNALVETDATKSYLIQNIGGTEEKDKVINSLKPEDLITMNLSGAKDEDGKDKLVAVPNWLSEMYPDVKNLESFNADGKTAKKTDLIENFYSISNNLSDVEAKGIKESPNYFLKNVEKLNADELARTLAFQRFVNDEKPHISTWDNVWGSVASFIESSDSKLYEWGVENVEFLSNLTLLPSNLFGSAAYGAAGQDYDWRSLDVREFAGLEEGGWLYERRRKQAEINAAVNSGALAAQEAGYWAGGIETGAVDLVLSMVALGETKSSIMKGVREIGGARVAKAAADVAEETGRLGKESAGVTKTLKKAAKEASLLSKSPTYVTEFNAIIQNAGKSFKNMYKGTEAALLSMPTSQVAKVLDSARKIASASSLAGTALDVLGTVATSAVVFNKRLTTRLLMDDLTGEETKQYIQQVMWDAAELEAAGVLTGLGGTSVKALRKEMPWLDEALTQAGEKASSIAMGVDAHINDAYLKFRDWLHRSSMAKRATSKRGVPNRTLAVEEALSEAIATNEFRKYVASQSVSVANTVNRAIELGDIKVTKEDFGEKLSLDPVNIKLSPFQEGKASFVEWENVRTEHNDIKTESSVLLNRFANPDIEPTTSQYISETTNATSELLKLEQEAGLLSKDIKKANKQILDSVPKTKMPKLSKSKIKPSKELDTSLLFGNHSKEVVIYAARSQELTIAIDEAIRDGVKLEESDVYLKAKKRYDAALENVTPEIAEVIDKKYLPALRRAEHEIVNYAIDPKNGFLPKNAIEKIRADGKFGADGMDYLRFVGRKDLQEGVYTRFDRLMKNDATMDIKKYAVPENDDDLTWIGYGMNALIDEIAAARNQKKMIDAAKKFGDTAVKRTVISGEMTEAADTVKRLKPDFEKTVVDGLGSFADDLKAYGGESLEMPETAVFKAEMSSETRAAYGVASSDAENLRAIMKDEGLMTTNAIIDGNTLVEFYNRSSSPAKAKIKEYFGEKTTIGGSEQEILSFSKFRESAKESDTLHQSRLDEIDRTNALHDKGVTENPEIKKLGTDAAEGEDIFLDNVIYDDALSDIELNLGKGDKKTISLDTDSFKKEVNNAIDGMIDYVAKDKNAKEFIEASNKMLGVEGSAVRTEFDVLSELMKKSNKKKFDGIVQRSSDAALDSVIPENMTITPAELKNTYREARKIANDQFNKRLSRSRNTLKRFGEPAESDAISERLKSLNDEILGYEAEQIYAKTTNELGQVEYLEVSPALGRMYNTRPAYNPMNVLQEWGANLALLKRTSLTSVNPRAFSKQLVSDSAMSFVTTGAIMAPGSYGGYSTLTAAQFGELARQLEKTDPRRFQNILDIAARDNITFAEAAMKESMARAETLLPFRSMSAEVARQASSAKYGTDLSVQMQNNRTVAEKFNNGIRKVSDKLGAPNDMRELATRRVAGAAAQRKALDQGYSWEQAEEFGRHAMDNATTNFRQKHAMFNALRSSTPYLTAGISGSKSFWKMFELDPIGVSGRILGGLVMPVIYFMSEITSDEELRNKYESLPEWEKANHIPISVGGELMLIPIGEELGKVISPITHMVESAYDENRYSFWLLAMNDLINFAPVDLTGFTDPELYENILDRPPDPGKIVQNGVAGVLAATMPPVLQSLYTITTKRDLYTGRYVDSANMTIDDEGNAVLQSYSQSEFAKAVANIIGGDAHVIEKATSGIMGTVILHALDTITSAVQYIGSGGKEGSVTTAMEKFASDVSAPYETGDYDITRTQFWDEYNALQRIKDNIEHGDPKTNEYIKYNEKIEKTRDPDKRRKLINKRNDLLKEYQDRVIGLIRGYRNAGGMLDGRKFSAVTRLLLFEDAIRADRAFMHLNTDYQDARAAALATLYSYGIKNPEGVSMLGYITRDENGNDQLKVWTPAQVQIVENQFYQQGDVHAARIRALLEDGTENSIKNKKKALSRAEQPYWDKYNKNEKLSKSEWNAIDDLRKAYNAEVVLKLKDYVDTYGAEYILNDETVIDYLENMIQVPSSYERVGKRYISSGNGKLNKQTGFAKSYIKMIFGVGKESK